MPNYEYIERESGETMTVNRPISERHLPMVTERGTFHLMEIPSRMNINTKAEGIGGGKDVIKGYYSQECKLGAKFKSEFKPDVIKKAWSTPYEK